MATSKLPEQWTAGALIYSGRRDPTWEVSQKVANKLVELWDGMPPASEMMPSTSRLGYRGVFLRGPGGREWMAFGGAASVKGPAGIEVRTDTAKKFEKTLLASAPRGLLPDLKAEL
jgi:hypothetical protein